MRKLRQIPRIPRWLLAKGFDAEDPSKSRLSVGLMSLGGGIAPDGWWLEPPTVDQQPRGTTA